MKVRVRCTSAAHDRVPGASPVLQGGVSPCVRG